MLIYNLGADGSLQTYGTSASMTGEQYQAYLKTTLGVQACPCLYCDASQGNCAGLGQRVANMIANQVNERVSRCAFQ